MAIVHFYEKPGCLNNARQKRLLIDAGHVLVVYDLLRQPWAEERAKLRSFFGASPVADWFNRAAPMVKSGRVTPEAIDERQAIDMMVADPLLIRRPLLEVDGRRRAGFDADTLSDWLAVGHAGPDLERCAQPHGRQGCGP